VDVSVSRLIIAKAKCAAGVFFVKYYNYLKTTIPDTVAGDFLKAKKTRIEFTKRKSKW
jgi:hypothetical protein